MQMSMKFFNLYAIKPDLTPAPLQKNGEGLKSTWIFIRTCVNQNFHVSLNYAPLNYPHFIDIFWVLLLRSDEFK
ncbi:MAG: hypothetical protein A3G23_02110 [Bacteroidetes bacterium RIFCSPLOWO2_12_FULL_37_12]|nr:MAG: hypothetical protein A3G23_02110 [Bacteroidetes bacterium RIFCSPLOWO2_12_FULL_37_12]